MTKMDLSFLSRSSRQIEGESGRCHRREAAHRQIWRLHLLPTRHRVIGVSLIDLSVLLNHVYALLTGLGNVCWPSLISRPLPSLWRPSPSTRPSRGGQCTTWRPMWCPQSTGKCSSMNQQVTEVTLKSSNIPIFISVSGEIGRDRASSGNWLTWECQDKHPERRVLLHRCLVVLPWIV